MARDVEVRLQRDNITKYISFFMSDKDCMEDAKLFRAKQSDIDMIENGKVYNAAIDVKPYDKVPSGYSCIIYNIDNSDTPPEYFADWVDNIHYSREVVNSALKDIIDTNYGKIAYRIVIRYWEKLSVWAAAKGHHHAKLGGLLKHTAEMVEMAYILEEYINGLYGYNLINRPLLISSVILHDVGKVKELDVDNISGNIEYSTEATLATHIMNIMTDVDIVAYELGLGVQSYGDTDGNGEKLPIKTDAQLKEEEESVLMLKHALASHHGRREWGSPIEPSIPEAYILHKIDEISVEMDKYNKIFKDIEPGEAITMWNSNGLKSMYRAIDKGDGYEEKSDSNNSDSVGDVNDDINSKGL